MREITDDQDSEGNRDMYEQLMSIAKYSKNMKLLLMSGTPMYNTSKEIIWIANILNKNDGRKTIKVSDVFDKNGELKKDGKETLIKKLRGYVSYVKGENPYTFPLRLKCKDCESLVFPGKQMNGKIIEKGDEMYKLVENMPICYTKFNNNYCDFELAFSTLTSTLYGLNCVNIFEFDH